MSEGGLLALRADDAEHRLGVVYSTSEATLRTFGVAYLRDPKTIGSLALLDPGGCLVATFDVGTEDWKEVDGEAA